MSDIFHYEWLNRNSLRNFPIQEDAGTSFPRDVIADARVLKMTGAVDEPVYLRAVWVSKVIVTLLIGTESAILGSAIFRRGGGSTSASLSPMAPGITGSISCGTAFSADAAFPLSEGIHDMGNSLPLEARCVTTVEGGLPLFSVGSMSGERLSGNVTIRESGDLAVTTEDVVDGDGLPASNVILSLNNLPTYASPCELVSDPAACDGPIYKINTVTPNLSGLINLEFVGFSAVTTQTPAILPVVLGDPQATCVRPPVPASDGSMEGDNDTGFTFADAVSPLPCSNDPFINMERKGFGRDIFSIDFGGWRAFSDSFPPFDPPYNQSFWNHHGVERYHYNGAADADKYFFLSIDPSAPESLDIYLYPYVANSGIHETGILLETIEIRVSQNTAIPGLPAACWKLVRTKKSIHDICVELGVPADNELTFMGQPDFYGLL